MDEKDLKFDVLTYLGLFEAAGSDKLKKTDNEKKRCLRDAFKQEIKKLAVIKQEKLDEEIKNLNERVDRLFLPQ